MDNFVVSPHAEAKFAALGCGRKEIRGILLTGVVLSRRERDEWGTAVDGYKHFLSGATPAGAILEVVLKIVRSIRPGTEEVLILITLYRGKA